MRVVAICAIVAFVAWCAALALAREPKLDAELAEARYYVASPVPTTTAAVPAPTGDAATSTAPPPLPQRVASPAAVVATAERGERLQVTATVPPPPVGLHGLPLAPAGLTLCETAKFYRQQAGLPERFDGIIWRESNCRPDARNWCCSGLSQIHKLWVSKLAHCGVFVRDDLYDPQRNMCAAAYVLAVQGINAWSTA